jgi:hypothetical protein
MTGYQRVTVQPKEWNKRQAAEDGGAGLEVEAGAELADVGEHVAVAEGTPLGSPEEPEVKRRMASSLPRRLLRPRMEPRMTAAGRSLETMAQVMIFFFSVGRTRSMRMRSRFGGQGKEGTLRTKGSAVMKRSTPAWRMHERTASWPAVKLRLTGTLPAKTTARLAMRPALPGGRTMATRSCSVSSRMRTLPAAR